jgi:hypothetical protein
MVPTTFSFNSHVARVSQFQLGCPRGREPRGIIRYASPSKRPIVTLRDRGVRRVGKLGCGVILRSWRLPSVISGCGNQSMHTRKDLFAGGRGRASEGSDRLGRRVCVAAVRDRDASKGVAVQRAQE